MNGAEARTRIFNETMRVCDSEESLRAAMAASAAGQRIIWQEDIEPAWEARFAEPAETRVSAKRSFEAARFYAVQGKRVCVLNFASSVAPGGGVTYGSQAQEESLCRISTLYPALTAGTAADFYSRHWELIRAGAMKRENRDDCIYTPGIIVLRDDAGDEPLLPESERYSADVITCAAPDLRAVDDGSMYAPTQEELFALLVRRWRRILAVAAANAADVLILGAFGCGVFANPPELVAQAFAHAARGIDRCFEVIEFAIAFAREDSPNMRAFKGITPGGSAPGTTA